MDGVLITGVYGSGKSTVAAEIAEQLERRSISYAALDLDWLTWFEVDDLDEELSERIFLDNLAGVVGNYVRAGVQHFVLAGAVRDRRALDHIADLDRCTASGRPPRRADRRDRASPPG